MHHDYLFVLGGKRIFSGRENSASFFYIQLCQSGADVVDAKSNVYTVLANSIPINILVFTHFLFTTVGTIVFEFVRKLKMPGEDQRVKDTYTWYLGFNNSMVSYLFLVLLNAALFFKIATMLSLHITGLSIFSACASLLLCFAVIIHWLKKTRQNRTADATFFRSHVWSFQFSDLLFSSLILWKQRERCLCISIAPTSRKVTRG